MNGPTRVSASISTDGEPISVLDFARFLYYLRAAYVLCLKEAKSLPPNEPLSKEAVQNIAQHACRGHLRLWGIGLVAAARRKLSASDDLHFVDISRHNPIDIAFYCIAGALAAAVIISGGEFTMSKDGIKVRLPPLGDGIAKIKKAFSSGSEEREAPRRKKSD